MKPYKAILLAVVAILFALPSHSYLSQEFNAKDLVLKSDVVCKVQSTSLSHDGVYEVGSFQPPLKTVKLIVKARVISTIKGQAPETIRILFPKRTQTVAFTALSRNEVTIVFLKQIDEHYEFTDIHNGSMECVPFAVQYEYGELPKDKMLSETLAICNSSTGKKRLGSVERLGELADIRASKTLRDLSQSPDPALRGVALMSRIQIGDTIKQDSLLEYLKLDTDLMDYGKSLAEYQRTAYTIAALTGHIMRALENSIQVKSWHEDMTHSLPSATLTGFDYIAFFEKASILPALIDSPGNRRSMASALRLLADKRSIPLVKRLLDDPSSDVRYLAVTALTRIYGEGPFPSSPTFKSNELEYISFWKDKLVQTE